MEYFSFYAIYAAIFIAFALLEFATGKFKVSGISSNNSWIDFISFVQSFAISGPLIAYGSAWIEAKLLPGAAGSLAGIPILLQIVAFLVLEDMVQYWWHRSSHTFPRMWPLHSPHHTAPYMGVRMVYRNGFFYGLLLPNLWLAGILVYLGFGKVYLGYSIVKSIVTLGAHSELRWDHWLYRRPLLRPLVWVLQRTISTPATHFAHHASNEADGIGHYSGNYGNLLFFWDVLFGTARITRLYPPAFGLEQGDGEHAEPWWRQLLYPLFQPRVASSVAKCTDTETQTA